MSNDEQGAPRSYIRVPVTPRRGGRPNPDPISGMSRPDDPDAVRLRVCAAATAPGLMMPAPVTAFASADVEVSRAYELMTGSELRALRGVAEPARVWPPRPAAATSAEGLEQALWDAPAPELFVAHGAGALRMLAPRSAAQREWICTLKAARLTWQHAPGFTLGVLVAWRGLAQPAATWNPDPGPREVAETARLTALLFADLLEAASLNVMLGQTTTRLMPLQPAPDLGDDLGWASLPDDDLEWFVNLFSFEGGRARAKQEAERRTRGGWATRTNWEWRHATLDDI